MNIGIPEVLLLLFVALLLFGSKAVPELGRSLGRFTSEIEEIKETITSAEKDLELPETDERLLVFLSSVMNSQDDLQRERLAIKSLFLHERLFSLWRFEDAPADDELESSYLDKVRECHLFLLVIGSTLSSAVLKEFEIAREGNKPILVFLKEGVDRSSEGKDFVASLTGLNLRYKIFKSEEDLRREVLRASYRCVVKYYKHGLTQKTYLACLALLFAIEEGEASAESILERDLSGDISTQLLQKVEQQAASDVGYRVSEGKSKITSDSLGTQWWNAYFHKKDYRSALYFAKKLVRDQKPFSFLRLAWTYESLNYKDEAIRTAYKGYKLAHGSEKETIMRWIGYWTSGNIDYLFATKRGAWQLR